MKMSIRILLAIGCVMLVLGGLGTIKGLQIGRMIAHSKSFVPPAQTVSVATVERTEWETTLSAVGSLQAVQGVIVAAELSGKVAQIAFESGSRVSAGQLLVQQDISEERARLRAAESRRRLARKNLFRARGLHAEKVISDTDLDESTAAYEQAAAEVESIAAVMEKKTVRAPFSGKAGIRQANLGQVLESGQAIVTLQSMDPIYVNFQLPQHEMIKLQVGQVVRASLETNTAVTAEGRITALNPEVDETTRNISVQATLRNVDELFRPGMYIRVAVVLPTKRSVLTIPATAVLHAPYSDSVFVVETRENGDGKQQQILRQQFVQLGQQQGDFIAVQKGLEAGETVVSSGVFKLRNGMPVVKDNSLSPSFHKNPQPDNA